MEMQEIIVPAVILVFTIGMIVWLTAYGGFETMKDGLSRVGAAIWAHTPWEKRKKAEKEYMELLESMKEDMVREMMKAGRTRLGEIKEQKEQQ